MNFKAITTRKESLYFPCVWNSANANPQHFFEKDGKITSFKTLEQTTTFLKKERPLLCRLGLKKFPKVGYVKSVSKTDYYLLQ